MKKSVFYLFLALLPMLAVRAQDVVAYGDHVQKRPVSGFTSVEAASGIHVVLTRGDKEELAVSANQGEYLDEVITEVSGGVLKINRSDNWKLWRKWKNVNITVYVSYKTLESLKASAGASIAGKDLNMESLAVRLHSGASLRLTGKVRSLEVEGNSGAIFHGYELESEKCKVSVSSGAGIQVNVSREISAKANSGGYVRFRGEGLIRDINVNSGGSVKRNSGA